MKQIIYIGHIWFFLLIQCSCVHKEINIKEVYFKKEPGITELEEFGVEKKLEKCDARTYSRYSDEVKNNIDMNHLYTLIEEAFIQSNGKSWYNVEINRVGKTCTDWRGKYHEN